MTQRKYQASSFTVSKAYHDPRSMGQVILETILPKFVWMILLLQLNPAAQKKKNQMMYEYTVATIN